MTQLPSPPLPGYTPADLGSPSWMAPIPSGPVQAARRRRWVWPVLALSAVLTVTATVIAVVGPTTVRGDGSPTSQVSSTAGKSSSGDSTSSEASDTTSEDGGLDPTPQDDNPTAPPPGAAGIDPAAFVSVLPADFPSCRPQPVDSTGNIAAAVCDEASSQPGPVEAHFYLYPDTGTLTVSFLR